jgi:hypothetical protein
MIGRIDTQGSGVITRVAEHASWMKSGPVVSHLADDDIALLEEHAAITVGDASALELLCIAI